MSKKATVHLDNQKIDLEQVGEQIFVHATSAEKDFRGNTIVHPTFTLLSLSAPEASLLANSLREFLGESTPLKSEVASSEDTQG